MMAMNLQTSYMHPPLGPTLFFLRGVAPPEITTRHIYVGIIPFVAIQLVCPGRAVVRAGACDRAAACALWWLRMKHESRRTVRSDRPRRAGHRRVERAGRAFRRGAGGERRGGRAGGAARRPARRPSRRRIESGRRQGDRRRGRCARPRRDERAPSTRPRRRSAPSPSWSTTPASRIRPAPSTVTEDEWNHVVRTNLDAVFFWAQEAARRMLAANKKGAIVNIASVLGFGVSKGTIAYATAKAGVIQMTKALGTRARLQGRARQRHRAGLVRHRHQPRLPAKRAGG